VKSYIALLKTPGVGRIIAAQLTARFPGGMLSLAFLIHIQQQQGSYGAAGLVLAATSAGQAVSGPLTGRWMGIWGMRRVLILTMIVCALAVSAIALIPMTVPIYMIVGLIAGLSYPPVQPAVRTIYPKMVNSTQLTPLFSLDASAQEIIWIAGPVITTFLAIQISSTVAIMVAVAFLVGGGIWFISSPALGRVRIPRSTRAFGTVLRTRTVLLATIVGFLLIGSCAAVEASVVSVFGQRGPQAGIVLAIWSIGSIIGGLSLGSVPIGPWALARRMLIVLVGLTASALVFNNFLGLSITLVLAGIGIAPALAVIFAIVSSSVKFSDTAEAYGWVGTGQLIGAALGSAAAGFLIDAHGPVGGFVAAVSLALVGFLVPLLLRGWHPDLRGKDASPIPDTEPVPIQPS
jgi:MFS family permease